MKKYVILLPLVVLLLSSLGLAQMMDWGNSGMMGWGGSGMMGGLWWPFGGGFGAFGIVWAVLWILGFLFWLWMLVDAITRRFDDNVEKLIWILVIIFVNIIGALIYYFVIKARNSSSAIRQGYRETRQPSKK